jgi:RNA polymerase sigma factor (sigma-70 family)
VKQVPEDDRSVRGTAPGTAAPTDAQLLARFARRADEGAFAALVERHGPMVLRVCRQLLRQPADAEDAFQAVFLVLMRRAGEVRQAELLGNWLYGVALRVAARLRAREARRRSREGQAVAMAEVGAESPETQPDLPPLLHQELDRLPEKYRAPIVLCYLQGKTNVQASEALRCPLGTVKVRLARARALLRSRLARRGVALSAVLAAAGLAQNRATAAPPPRPLLRTTVQEALRFRPDGSRATPGRPARLAQEVLHGERQRRVWIVAAGIVLILLLVGVGGLLFRPQSQTPGDQAARSATERRADGAGPRDGRADAAPRDRPADGAAPRDRPADGAAPRERPADGADRKDPVPGPPPPGDAEKIRGRWRMKSYSVNGGKDTGARELWIFGDDNKARVKIPGAREVTGPYSLDLTKMPRQLTVIEGANNFRYVVAIYELKDDDLTISFSAMGGELPRDFSPAKGTILITFKREPPK